jgi:hypothetical protein
LIRTRYGLGYQFCGEAQTIGDGPEPPSRGDLAYRLVWGVRDIALERGENVIGRT